MNNRIKQLDRKLDRLKALVEAKRRRENPRLAVKWLLGAQERRAERWAGSDLTWPMTRQRLTGM
jgi:hypothetical protein